MFSGLIIFGIFREIFVMLLDTFINIIPIIETAKLGGLDSQFKLSPRAPKILIKAYKERKNVKKAAVLILFYPNGKGELMLLLTQRASYKGTHSSQISFTGGKLKEGEMPINAALRESFEEVGLRQENIKIVRALSSIYIPPSNFFVYSFLAYTETIPNFTPNYEVAEIIEVPVKDLYESVIQQREIKTSYMNLTEVPCFVLRGKIIWGATAMLLSELKDLIIKTC